MLPNTSPTRRPPRARSPRRGPIASSHLSTRGSKGLVRVAASSWRRVRVCGQVQKCERDQLAPMATLSASSFGARSITASSEGSSCST